MLHADRQAAGMLKIQVIWDVTLCHWQIVADISKDHSAIIFSAKLHSEHKSYIDNFIHNRFLFLSAAVMCLRTFRVQISQGRDAELYTIHVGV